MQGFKISDSDIIFLKPNRVVQPYSWVGHIPFAFFLIEQLEPSIFVELGVHTGNSYNAFCQAVSLLKTQTRCFGVDTWRGDEHAGFYEENVYKNLAGYQKSRYKDFSKLLKMTFDKALKNFDDKSIDLLHIDGMHTYKAVKHDFDSWLPKMSNKGVILLHDTQVFEKEFGVFKLWEEISNVYPSIEFFHGFGLGVVAVGENVSDKFLKFIRECKTKPFFINLFAELGNNIIYEKENQDLKELNSNLSDLVNSIDNRNFSQIYIDTGDGWNEENSVKQEIDKNTDRIVFYIPQFDNIKAFRLDIIDGFAHFFLKKIAVFDDENNEYNPSDFNLWACSNEGNEYLFETKDSWISFSWDKDTVPLRIEIEVEFLSVGEEAVDFVINKKRQDSAVLKSELQAVYNSKSWIITKPLRKLKKIFRGLKNES
jgi:hypothetical protein